jgi:hypothetical protein
LLVSVFRHPTPGIQIAFTRTTMKGAISSSERKSSFQGKRRTLQDDYGPMSKNNKHEAANDVAVLRPDCHAKITGVRLHRDRLGSTTHVQIAKLMLAKATAAYPAS